MTPSEIIDAERSQIGHDLHDQLLPLIFAASATVQTLCERESGRSLEPSDLEKLRQANQWLNDAMVLGRNLLSQIYPAELEKVSWLVAAQDTLNRIAGQKDYASGEKQKTCELVWEVDQDSPVCDPEWRKDHAASAYRILIEATRNAVRHGGASVIRVHCRSDAIDLIDNGKGFDPANVDPSRYGIRSMKGRASLVGMSLSVQSQPGGQTSVTIGWS